MDERQSQIKEGAGLEESRINQDLLDFLNRIAPYACGAVVLLSGGYYLYGNYQRQKQAEIENAFGEWATIAADANPSPVSLGAFADEYDGVGSVSHLARLKLADLHLNAALTGAEPGAALGVDGSILSELDALTDEERAGSFSKAESIYRAVLNATESKRDLAAFAVAAASGVAAAQASGPEADIESAVAMYERAAEIARGAGLDGSVTLAEAEIAALQSVGSIALLSQEDLPRFPGDPEPPPEPEPEPEPELPVDDGVAGPLPEASGDGGSDDAGADPESDPGLSADDAAGGGETPADDQS